MIDFDELPPPPTLSDEVYSRLARTIATSGKLAAVDELCEDLRRLEDYHALFYAMLMHKRVELGVSPFPTGPSSELPAEIHEEYENAIRIAGRTVGAIYLEHGQFDKAWFFYRMLGEPQTIIDAIDRFEVLPETDCQSAIDIAFYQNVHPKKGFEIVVSRFGICSAITAFSSHDFAGDTGSKLACIALLVRSLHAQLRERLLNELVARGESAPENGTVAQLMLDRAWLFEDGSYHIDTSHLSSVTQMALELIAGPEVAMARDLCWYGEHLADHFRHDTDSPFEKGYADYRRILEIYDGVDVDTNLAYFRDKIEPAIPDGNTLPAEVMVNLLLRLNRAPEAVTLAKQYLAEVARPMMCPGVYELCRDAGDFAGLAEMAKRRGDGVTYLAAKMVEG